MNVWSIKVWVLLGTIYQLLTKLISLLPPYSTGNRGKREMDGGRKIAKQELTSRYIQVVGENKANNRYVCFLGLLVVYLAN